MRPFDRPFGWDLPPGVNASDIPGNRPEDAAWEKMMDDFYLLATMYLRIFCHCQTVLLVILHICLGVNKVEGKEVTIMNPEDILEQAANLLGLWKTRLKNYEDWLLLNKKKPRDVRIVQEAQYHCLKDCAGELESILTGKPLP